VADNQDDGGEEYKYRECSQGKGQSASTRFFCWVASEDAFALSFAD
jgi:hypothetical protein